MMTRQGERKGVCAITETSGTSRREREASAQVRPVFCGFKIHAGVVFDVRFGYGNPSHAGQFGQQR